MILKTGDTASIFNKELVSKIDIFLSDKNLQLKGGGHFCEEKQEKNCGVSPIEHKKVIGPKYMYMVSYRMLFINPWLQLFKELSAL